MLGEVEAAGSLEAILPQMIRYARSAENERLARHGTTLPQFFTMVALDGHDGYMMRELGEHLGLSFGTVTGIVDRLEKSGFAERFPDERDRRVVRVRLTGKGQRVLGDVNRDRAEALAAATEDIPSEHLSIFFEVLAKVLRGMAEDG